MVEASLRYAPQTPVPPGEVLAELLEERGMTQAELARRAGLSKDHVSRIIRAVAPVTFDTALALERVLQLSASFWVGMENTYRELKQRAVQEDALSQTADIVRQFPYAELVKYGYVEAAAPVGKKAEQLLSFMGVASFEALGLQYPVTASLRVAASKRPSPYALAAWLRMGELAAATMATVAYDEQALRAVLPRLRELSRVADASFQHLLRDRLAQCGVALCLVPHLPRTYAHGATQWLRPDKAMIQLSLRGAYADVFWFTLCHEIGHLLLRHSKKKVYITFEHPGEAPEEHEANCFAQNALIPPEALADFRARPHRRSRQAILHFAADIGVAPGIVVGRLQHDGDLPRSHLNALRPKLAWAAPAIEGAANGCGR